MVCIHCNKGIPNKYFGDVCPFCANELRTSRRASALGFGVAVLLAVGVNAVLGRAAAFIALLLGVILFPNLVRFVIRVRRM